MSRMNHTSIRQFVTFAKKNFMMMTKIIKKNVLTAIIQKHIEALRIVSVI